MAIQARRGLETDFKPEKMLPGELAVTTDTRKIYATFAPGDCKRMATYEDMVDDIEEANEEIIRNMTTVVSEATTNAQNATAAAETATTNATAAAEAAERAAQSVTATIATSTQAGAVKPTNDFLIGEAGALKLNTEFTVPEGLTNLVSGSDWNVILGQLAKLVGDYMDTISTLDSNMWLQLTTHGTSYTSILSIVQNIPDSKDRIYAINSTFTDYPPILKNLGYTTYPVARVTSNGAVRFVEVIACNSSGKTKVAKGFTTTAMSYIVWQLENNILGLSVITATNTAANPSGFTCPVPAEWQGVTNLYIMATVGYGWGNIVVTNAGVTNGLITIHTTYTGSVVSPTFYVLAAF